MALVAANLGTVKVESRLQQSLDSFTRDLTPDQRRDFLQDRQFFRQRYPDENDVFVFVAKLNSNRASQKQLCYGPRFLNILQVAQQFAAVGDILVGGSQNLIASGVWATVRAALLLVVKADSNLDKLSHMFMIAGQSAPRYEAMSRLYNRKSKRLLSYYQEYFLILIDMCRRFVQIVNKSSVSRLFSTISDSDIGSFQKGIAHWASMIKEEALLLMAQGVEEQGLSLSGLLDISRTTAQRRRSLDNARVLAACSTYDYQANWKRFRKMGNTTLFTQTREYVSWRSDADTIEKSGTLIYTGKLGAGKSVLMANMIEDLNIHVTQSKVAIAYFFCQHDEVESLKARSIVGSLARQFLLTTPDLSKAEAHLSDYTQELPLEDMISLLKEVLPIGFKAYCVIDGLDECDDLERRLLVSKLRELQDTFALRICFSFRLEADNALRLDTKGFKNCETATIPEDNPEIEQFICDELERCIDSERLTLGDPTLVADIMNTLLDLSQGMFLWVALQITSLCACKTDNDVRQALADMPKDLAETFTRVLNKCEPFARNYQKQILELVMVASRPLTTEELREALSVVAGDTDWNPGRLPNNVYSVLASCGSLLTVDEETSSIRIVHQSARDFLLGYFKGRVGEAFLNVDIAEANMSWTIVTYLNYGIFDTQLSRPAASTAIPTLIPSAVVSSSGASNTVKNLSLMLLRARKSSASKIDMTRVLEDIRGQAKQATSHNHHFYSYASSNWIHHVAKTRDMNQKFITLVSKILSKHALSSYNNDTKFEFLHWTARHDNNIYKTVFTEANTTSMFQHKLLTWATRQGDIHLLQAHSATISLEAGSLSALLPIAALNGQFSTIEFLLHLLTDNISTATLATAIMMAITGNHASIVHFLLTGQPPNNDKSNLNETSPPAQINSHLSRQGTNMLHKRPQSRKLLAWADVFNREHLALLMIDLGAKTTDALQPKEEEELRSHKNDYSESSLIDEVKYQIFGHLRNSIQGELDDEQEGMLIRAAKVLFETHNVSMFNSFLIAKQEGSA